MCFAVAGYTRSTVTCASSPGTSASYCRARNYAQGVWQRLSDNAKKAEAEVNLDISPKVSDGAAAVSAATSSHSLAA